LFDYPGEPVPESLKPIWILLEQETVSGSGISLAICKSAPRSRQITMPAPHHSESCRDVGAGRLILKAQTNKTNQSSINNSRSELAENIIMACMTQPVARNLTRPE